VTVPVLNLEAAKSDACRTLRTRGENVLLSSRGCVSGFRKFLCANGEFPFDSLSHSFSDKSSAHLCAQTFISNHARSENGPKMRPLDLLSSVHVFQRNPVGHSQRTRDVGPAMASSPRGREVFGALSVKALRIAFGRKNSIDMRKVTKRSTAWSSSH